jgi:hypothetical protein
MYSPLLFFYMDFGISMKTPRQETPAPAGKKMTSAKTLGSKSLMTPP